MYAAVGLVRHWHFGSNAYDLGLFDQMVWHLGRFEAPASTIHGLSNMFGDHFSPIHVLFVPLSWLWPSAGSLIVTQAIAFGASIVPVWIFLERRLPPRPAMLMTLAYGCFWGLQRAAQFDVHEFAFAPLLIAVMLLGIDTPERPWPLFLTGAIGLCLTKEDQIPLVVAASLLLAMRGGAAVRRHALMAAGLALVAFFAVVRVVIPALNDRHAWAVGSAFGDVLAHPFSLFGRLVSPPTKLQTLLMWLLPFAFLPLVSSYGLLIIPLALERFLSSSPTHWGTSFHYTAPLAPILAMAAGDALGRLRARLRPSGGYVGPSSSSALTPIAAACLVLCAILPGRQPMWRVFSPAFYQAPVFAETAQRALSLIPADASVVAQSAIAPHLTRRQTIYMLRTEGLGANADADFVIAAAADLPSWPMTSADEVRRQLAMYVRRGYTTVFEEQGWVVLARGATR